jgi:hypothetical protein
MADRPVQHLGRAAGRALMLLEPRWQISAISSQFQELTNILRSFLHGDQAAITAHKADRGVPLRDAAATTARNRDCQALGRADDRHGIRQRQFSNRRGDEG